MCLSLRIVFLWSVRLQKKILAVFAFIPGVYIKFGCSQKWPYLTSGSIDRRLLWVQLLSGDQEGHNDISENNSRFVYIESVFLWFQSKSSSLIQMTLKGTGPKTWQLRLEGYFIPLSKHTLCASRGRLRPDQSLFPRLPLICTCPGAATFHADGFLPSQVLRINFTWNSASLAQCFRLSL